MKSPSSNSPNRLFRAGAAALALIGALTISAGAQAAPGETSAGATVSNLATLSYSVGGTAQANIGSTQAGNTSGAGTATTFLVDSKVNLTLIERSTSFTSVAPGALNQVTAFTLTNTGNDTHDYSLTAANVTATVFGLADTFDVANFEYYIDVNNDQLLDVGDTSITAVNDLARDASINLLVVADIPAAQGNGTQAAISLTAVALTSAGAALTEAVNTQGGVEYVFADAATTSTLGTGGTDPGQTARDRTAVAYDAYRVAAAIISVSKTTAVVCDPFNGSGANRANIPGAIVRWTVTVSNSASASASATLTQVTDALNTNTTFDPNLVTGAGAPATATSCTSAGGAQEGGSGSGFKLDVTGDTRPGTYPKFFSTANDTDGADLNGTTVEIDYGPAMPNEGTYSAGELKPGESVIVYFNVTIN